MSEIKQRLDQVRNRVAYSAERAGRNSDSVTLLAVSKRHSVASILSAHKAGQEHFGENYCQEMLDKISTIEQTEPGTSISWHFIGPVQSNKTRALAEKASWIHTIDREKIADRLAAQRPGSMPPLNVCIQINIDREQSKSGILPLDTIEFAEYVNGLKNLSLRGLMAIPKKKHDSDAGEAFELMANIFEDVRTRFRWSQWDTLSMGMSADLELAIARGATIVRVGTDIFGSRE